MHYKNGREAKNGDLVFSLTAKPPIIGFLYNATAGNNYCNGAIAQTRMAGDQYANLSECLHLDDVLAAVAKAPELQAPPPPVEEKTAEAAPIPPSEVGTHP